MSKQVEYNRRSQAKQREIGLVRVTLVVPEERVEYLKTLAERWRARARKIASRK